MRKGLVSFIVILCILIFLTVGCQSNSGDSTSPSSLQSQTIPPELSVQPTGDGSEIAVPDNTGPENTQLETEPTADSTRPDIQETVPAAEATNTEPPRETAPPVTEEPEYTDPKPTQPKPTEPESAQPQPTEPASTDPPVTEPAEVIDLDDLVQYGLSYAANTHGYEISPGLRDGYYPAYTCVFDTMEEGKAAVRNCIDDTTRALLAVPGSQIVVEINGVLYRIRIDIAIVPKDEGTYLISVYYG